MKQTLFFLVFCVSCATTSAVPSPEITNLPACNTDEIVQAIEHRQLRFRPQDRLVMERIKQAIRNQNRTEIQELIFNGTCTHLGIKETERQFWIVLLALADDYLARPTCESRHALGYTADVLEEKFLAHTVYRHCEVDVGLFDAARIYLLWQMNEKGGYSCVGGKKRKPLSSR